MKPALRATRWGLLVLVASCSFLDDFERFGIAPASDAGSDGGSDATNDLDASADAALRDDGGAATSDASREGGATEAAQDASSLPDTGVPTDAGAPPETGGATGCGAGNEPLVTCYPDRDGDGFPDLAQQPVRACRCESDALAVGDPESAPSDCWDDPATRGKDVFPGQTVFFDRGYGPGGSKYDYDCNGNESRERGVYANDCAGLLGLACADKAGFGAVTACGVRATYVSCKANSLLACQAETDQRTQACR